IVGNLNNNLIAHKGSSKTSLIDILKTYIFKLNFEVIEIYTTTPLCHIMSRFVLKSEKTLSFFNRLPDIMAINICLKIFGLASTKASSKQTSACSGIQRIDSLGASKRDLSPLQGHQTKWRSLAYSDSP